MKSLFLKKKNNFPKTISIERQGTPALSFNSPSLNKNIFGIFAAIRNNSVFLQLTLCGLGY